MTAVSSTDAATSAPRRVVATHRHTTHEHEHEFEAAPGLPEPLPDGEHVLWQGAPDWKMLARECFHVRKLALYFAVLVAWRAATVARSGADWQHGVIAVALAAALAVTALGLVSLMAWLSARTALYTITDQRVVMRVGIVLSVTFNLPFRKSEAAGLHPLQGGHGDIALALDRATRIAYPHLWPYVRPWQIAHPQPTLRCVVDAAQVAGLLTDAWRAACVDVAVQTARPAATRALATPIVATTRDVSFAVPQAA